MLRSLLVVDAQRIYTDPESEMKCRDSNATIGRINRLIQAFEKARLPIFLIRHIHKSDGSDLGRMFDYAGDEVDDFNFKEGTNEVEFDDRLIQPSKAHHLKKTRYSAFIKTDLDKRLKKLGVDRVVICGFMTNFCCESTARNAHGLDYFVDFVVDATGTPGTENLTEAKIRKTVGELLGEGFAEVHETDGFLKSM
jgi:nicotinamidase-related amidase